MNKVIKLAVLLGTIGLLMTFALAEINVITLPLIAKQQAEKTQKALQAVLPETQQGALEEVRSDDGKVNYYIGFSDKEKKHRIGYAFEALKSGYSGDVISIVGVDTLGVIKGVVITRQTETPGLGAKCVTNEPFDGKKYTLQQYIGKQSNNLKVDKDGGEIISITGATITTRTLTGSIKDKLQQVLNKIKTGA